MKYQSKAIPLKSFKYSESSIIAKILTQKYGIQTSVGKSITNFLVILLRSINNFSYKYNINTELISNHKFNEKKIYLEFLIF